MIKNFFQNLFELLKIALIALAIVLPVRYFLIQPFNVQGSSMVPNFETQEYLIIDEISYRFEEPKRGEVVVFRYPENPQKYFIKRIIGLPGEEVEIKKGQVYIYNDQHPEGYLLQEEYLGDSTYTAQHEKVSLDKNEYYLLGDNRSVSKDSRSFGPVNESFFIGKVWIRGFPLDKAKVFDELPNY